MTNAAKTNAIDPLLNTARAAGRLGVSISWLAKSRMRGDGPRFTKLGRSVKYAESALVAYIKAQMRSSTKEP